MTDCVSQALHGGLSRGFAVPLAAQVHLNIAGRRQDGRGDLRAWRIERRDALLEIRQLLPHDTHVEFALEDDDGNEMYPTGTIQVRFTETPSDQELSTLCADLGLRLLSRNDYQPKQAAFEAANRLDADLSVDIRRLEDTPGVRRAWPEVRARYRRY